MKKRKNLVNLFIERIIHPNDQIRSLILRHMPLEQKRFNRHYELGNITFFTEVEKKSKFDKLIK